jgi:[NiFe] hydrogenase assembly HybE family chaperone
MNSDDRPLFRSRQADAAVAVTSDAPMLVEPAAGLLPDPSPRLVNAFRAVEIRMVGLSFVNPALAVEAVGFAPWQGHWLGVMLTPWFMNLTLAPRDVSVWQSLKQGGKRYYRFPAGDYDFIGAQDDLAGEYQLCSLFSPVLQFENQQTARLVAQLARDALFDVENAEQRDMPVANLSPMPGPRVTDPGPLERLEDSLDAPQSKRDFLRGRWAGDDRGNRG